MFAGPNGSGKSTLKMVLHPKLLGVYLNPDEMERELRTHGILDLTAYRVTAAMDEVRAFFRDSTLLQNAGLAVAADSVSARDGRLIFPRETVNSYVASAIAEFLRQRLLEARIPLTLETVMSHPGKVELLAQAQRLGYRTYLYFIATDDPAINISRVRSRVQRGGHAVPEDKIVKRYHASLGLLMDAIRNSNRAYIFDNSGKGRDRTWIAEVTDGRNLEMRTQRMPAWFKRAVWDKIIARTA